MGEQTLGWREKGLGELTGDSPPPGPAGDRPGQQQGCRLVALVTPALPRLASPGPQGRGRGRSEAGCCFLHSHRD